MSGNSSGAVHPTAILAVWALAGFGLGKLFPVAFVPASIERALEVSTLVPAVALMAGAMIELWRHDTIQYHTRPTTTLVTSGPFRFSRNPLYVGLALLMVGFSVAYESLWALLLIVPAMIAIRQLTVLPEEAYLEREFGDAYRRYASSVRRWI